MPMRIQLTSSYFYVPSRNPLSHLVRWWYFDNCDGTYSLEVIGKVQRILAKAIYRTDKMSAKFISKYITSMEE